jgi:hypothetical protein
MILLAACNFARNRGPHGDGSRRATGRDVGRRQRTARGASDGTDRLRGVDAYTERTVTFVFHVGVQIRIADRAEPCIPLQEV